MKKFLTIFFTLLFISTSLFASGNVIEKDGEYYFANKIVVKFADNSFAGENLNVSRELESIFKTLGVTDYKPMLTSVNKTTRAGKALSGIYEMNISSVRSIKYIAAKLSKTESVEWAEPYYLYKPHYDPNDPSTSSQYFLDKISAYAAWDVTKGDPSVIIAIDDTGVDWNHPDLNANIWINTAEQNGTDGVDDDNNGYIDDIHGWDFGGLDGTPDADPTEDRSDHGTHVAGCAAEVTDNGTGGAGIGFNCSIMPVKTSRDDVRNNSGLALISYGYQGIVYAVDNGAHIINCSWGGGNYSLFAKSVVDYAVENNVLIVASSGNDNMDTFNYPGAYEGVFAVGATNSSDSKASFSNYGYWVDVTAPGVGIWSTWQDDTYAVLGGTSMSSPIVAGLAGLIKSQFPDYTAEQIAQQIRATTDDISVSTSSYEYKLGTGRVNAHKAVSTTDAISARIKSLEFIEEGNGNGALEPGENVIVKANFHNYLSATSALTVTFNANDSYITYITNTFNAGAIDANTAFTNDGNEFKFQINNNCPNNYTLGIRFDFEDGTYSDYYFKDIILNPSYFDHSGNNVTATITSRGNIGYNNYPNNTQGSGIRFLDSGNLTFEGAFMVGINSTQVMDVARDNTVDNSDNDWDVKTPFIINAPGDIAEQQGYGSFTDEVASNPIGLRVDQHTYVYTADADANYIILKYVIKNTGTSTINDVFAGIFMDWDVDEISYETNIAMWDDTDKFGYCYNQDNTVSPYYGATALLSSEDYNFYAIDNESSPNIYDGFNSAEKYQVLSSGTTNNTAGPKDVATSVSGGPFSINAGEYIEVGFAVAVDTALDGIRQSVQNARAKYPSIITDVDNQSVSAPVDYSLSQNFPNPFNPATTINYSVPDEAFVKIRVFDVLGREVMTLVNSNKKSGYHKVSFDASSLASGIYIYTIEAGNFKASKKMTLMK